MPNSTVTVRSSVPLRWVAIRFVLNGSMETSSNSTRFSCIQPPSTARRRPVVVRCAIHEPPMSAKRARWSGTVRPCGTRASPVVVAACVHPPG